MSENAIRILIVDDNRQYREAFARNLIVAGFEVQEAEHGDQAMEILKTTSPDIMVTDLQMRTQTEGLTLIRNARAIFPCLPIIMISAVGTFDEGATASKLGAAHVLSKARIDEEITVLHDAIRRAYTSYKKAQRALDDIAKMRPSSDESSPNNDLALDKLRDMLADPDLDAYVKSEAFDVITDLTQNQMRQRSQQEASQALSAEEHREVMKQVDREVAMQIPDFQLLHEETRETIITAEYLFQRAESTNSLDFSRSICFSYCFSVENEAKAALRKRLLKFLGEKSTIELVRSLMEKGSTHVSLFFQQYILQTMRDRVMDFTIDNVRQTFMRILEHAGKYRPDGLKALGIMVLCFGRTYEFKQFNKTIRIENPLGLRGVESSDEVVHLAELLVNLQHFRNPYIHPEISNRENLSKIRKTAIECLNLVTRLK